MIHARNRLDETALHFLAIEGYCEGVAFLAQHGASVDVTDGYKTPLILALPFGGSTVSHIIMRRDDPFAQTVVPNHRQIDRGTLRAILRQTDITADDLIKLL